MPAFNSNPYDVAPRGHCQSCSTELRDPSGTTAEYAYCPSCDDVVPEEDLPVSGPERLVEDNELAIAKAVADPESKQ